MDVILLKRFYLKENEEKYKWVITGMCVLVLCIGLGFCSSAKNIYIAPITEAFGFSRSAFTVNDTCRYVTVSVVTLFFYTLVQKFGTKKLFLAGLFCYIIYSLLNAFATTLAGFYLAGIFLGLGVAWTSTTMVSLVVNTWFDKNQGTVLGAVLASNALGSAIAVYILTPIIYEDGNPFAFKKAYLLTALLLLITTLIFAIFYREKAKNNLITPKKEEDSAKKEEYGLAFTEILKLPEFYITLLCLFFFALTTINNIVPPHFDDIGFEPSFVASVLSIFSVGLAVSKILVGIFYDRFGIRTALNICLISSAVSKLLLLIINLSPTGKVLATLHCVLSALGTPIETVMLPIITLGLFGKKSFVKTLSVISIASTVGHSLCSPVLNLPYDISGDYSFSFGLSLVLCIVIIIAMNVVVSTLKSKNNI